jgi:serine/threonine-protein kinase HipA
VFEDSLPDDWGRRILTKRYQLNREDQRVPQLLGLLKGDGMERYRIAIGRDRKVRVR